MTDNSIWWVVTGRVDGADEDTALPLIATDPDDATNQFKGHLQDIYNDEDGVLVIYVNYVIECGETAPVIRRVP